MVTVQEQDALAEVVNIAFGRAAASLSELTGYRVLLQPPHIELHPIERLGNALAAVAGDDIASVHQVFNGPVSGDAFLVLRREEAGLLARLLAGGDGKPATLSHSDQDVLTEVGNMLLGACLGTFGNLLRVQVQFTVPCLRLESLTRLLNSMVVDAEEMRFGLVIMADFRVREANIHGYLVIVLAVASLERLLQEVRQLI